MARQIINIGISANDGTGTSLRDGGLLINENFDELYTATGGAQYIDGTYTEASPLTITSAQGSSGFALPCDNATVIDGNVPPDFVNGMWDATNNKLLAVNDKDRFITEIRFKAKTSVNNDAFELDLDIGGALGSIRKQSFIFSKNANTEQSFARPIHYFTGATFIANGGTLLIGGNSGTLSIYDIEIVPTRIHKGY